MANSAYKNKIYIPTDTFIQLTEKGSNDGVAPLDSSGKVPSIHISESLKEYVVADIAERDGLSPVEGTRTFVIDASDDPSVDTGSAGYIYDGTSWIKKYEEESLDLVLSSANTSYDNTTSGLDAITVKAALDEIIYEKHTFDSLATFNNNAVVNNTLGIGVTPTRPLDIVTFDTDGNHIRLREDTNGIAKIQMTNNIASVERSSIIFKNGIIRTDSTLSIGGDIGTSKFEVYKSTDSVNRLASFGYSGLNNRSINIQQVKYSGGAQQFLFLNGSLGDSSTSTDTYIQSAYANVFGFKSTDGTLQIISNGTDDPSSAVIATTLLKTDSSGNFNLNGTLGIGADSDGSMLYIEKGTTPTIKLVRTDSDPDTILSISSSVDVSALASNKGLYLYSGDTQTLKLEDDNSAEFLGNVGIGGASDGATLQINSDTIAYADFKRSGTLGLRIGEDGSGVGTIYGGGTLAFRGLNTSGSHDMMINSDGDIIFRNKTKYTDSSGTPKVEQYYNESTGTFDTVLL